MVTHLAPTHLPYAHKSNDTINLYLRTALVVPPKIPSKPISLLWAAANTLCSNFYLLNLIFTNTFRFYLLLSCLPFFLLLIFLALVSPQLQSKPILLLWAEPTLHVQTFTNSIDRLRLLSFLASQDAIEVMFVTEWVRDRLHWLYWCDPGEPGYL